MCVGAVESCEKSCNPRNSLIKPERRRVLYPYRRLVLVTCGQTDRVGFGVPH